MKKISLGSLRIDEKTKDNITSAIAKYNKKSLVKMSIQDFRRLAYEYFSQTILNDEDINLEINR